jgi:hypothetical protein
MRRSGRREHAPGEVLCGIEKECDRGARAIQEVRADRQYIGLVRLAIAPDVGIGAAAVAVGGVAEAFEQDGAAKLRNDLVSKSLPPSAHQGTAPIVRGMDQLMRPGGQVLDAYRDRLAVAVVTEFAGSLGRECRDLESPGASHFDQRKRREEGSFILGPGQGLALGLGVAEHRDAEIPSDYGRGHVLRLVLLRRFDLADGRSQDVKGALSLTDMAADLLPLAVAAGVLVSQESREELIAPAPTGAGARVVQSAADEDLRAGGGNGPGLEGGEDLIGNPANV